MNEKEAREIVQDIRNVGVPGTDSYEELDHAKGYLEAIDKAKGLEEALEEFIGAIKTDRHITNKWFCYKKGIEALAKYRSEK